MRKAIRTTIAITITIHPFFTKAALFVKNLYMLYKKYKIPRTHTNSIKANNFTTIISLRV